MGSKLSRAVDRRRSRSASFNSPSISLPQNTTTAARHSSPPTIMTSIDHCEPFSLDFTNIDSFAAMNPQLPLGPPNYAHTADVDSHGFSDPFQNQTIQMSSFPSDSTPPPALERRFTDAYGSADPGRHGRLLNFLEERRQSAPPAPLAQHIPVMPPPSPPLAPPMQADAPPVIVQSPKKSPPSNVSCIVCCDQFTAEQEPSSVLRPCRTCRSIYCTSCVKDMFIKACKDPSRMPPRCCNMLQLHFALPFLSKAEAMEYREKYEEWSTPDPIYCPIPTCSAFVPNRLIPPAPVTKKAGKQRADSVIEVLKPPTVACPKCSADICLKCRQLSHPGAPCVEMPFGIDEKTATILKRWGYKRCPKCRHGIRRMLGCNHMQCLCGAQWCWVCQMPMDECGGNCYEDDDENIDEDGEDSDTASIITAIMDGTPITPTTRPLTPHPDEHPVHPISPPDPNPPAPSENPVPRRRNLDAGSPAYWESRGLFFGNEPGEEPPDRAWLCSHSFVTAKVDFEDTIKGTATAAGMECSRCWSAVYPEVNLPKKVSPGGVKMVAGWSRNVANRLRGMGRGRGRNARVGGMGRQSVGSAHIDGQTAQDVARDHIRCDAAVPSHEGMHWHLDLGLDCGSGSSSADVSPASAIVDFEGDLVMLEDVSSAPARSSSFSAHTTASSPVPLTPNLSATLVSSSAPHLNATFSEVFAPISIKSDVPLHLMPNLTSPTNSFRLRQDHMDTKDSPFSFAYECTNCGILVCETCKAVVMPPSPLSEKEQEIGGGRRQPPEHQLGRGGIAFS